MRHHQYIHHHRRRGNTSLQTVLLLAFAAMVITGTRQFWDDGQGGGIRNGTVAALEVFFDPSTVGPSGNRPPGSGWGPGGGNSGGTSPAPWSGDDSTDPTRPPEGGNSNPGAGGSDGEIISTPPVGDDHEGGDGTDDAGASGNDNQGSGSNNSDDDSSDEESLSDEARAAKIIRKALKKHGGDVQKAHDEITARRRRNQESSDDKSLVYAQYWLKGRGMEQLLSSELAKTLGDMYAFDKQYADGWVYYFFFGSPSKNSPSPFDPETDRWFEKGVENELPSLDGKFQESTNSFPPPGYIPHPLFRDKYVSPEGELLDALNVIRRTQA